MALHAGPSARTARLIAIDWGTSAMRAYLLGDDGIVLDTRAEPWGIMQLAERDFAGAFDAVTKDWRARQPDLPAIAAGMIGSAQGWIEAPYCSSPAGIDELARSLASVPNVALSIIPGVIQVGESPNVMRGEETQIVGALTRHPELAAESLLVLPGTHSKWVRVSSGMVTYFWTYLTGELFAVLAAHSTLGRLARDLNRPLPAAAANAAFARGVEAARASTVGMSPVLFSTRALVLAGRLDANASLEYLSGVLIGDEVRCGLAGGLNPAALIGDGALCARYRSALALFGVDHPQLIEDSAPAGMWAIAQHALLGAPTTSRTVA